MKTTQADAAGLAAAVLALRSGALVALPTETVYGLGALARNESALKRVFEVKGRPGDHPLIVHLPDASMLEQWVLDVTEPALALGAAFWPGPLTLLLRRHPSVLDIVTGGRPTVGLRIPDHEVALEVLRCCGDGVAAPSANRFGAVSPTRAEHVIRDIGDRLDPARDVVLDGGPCAVGLESTIVDLTTPMPTILRPGAVTAEAIEAVLDTRVHRTDYGPSRAPGMLAAHYAPRCEVLVARGGIEADTLAASRRSCGQTVGVLSFDDLDEFARRLYGALREADDQRLDTVVVVVPPATGIGVAIVDRLTRAATGSARRSAP